MAAMPTPNEAFAARRASRLSLPPSPEPPSTVADARTA